MQQLRGKFKNVPRSTTLAPCSTTSILNREKTPYPLIGARCIEEQRTRNDGEVNHQQHRAGQNLRVSGIVYVLNLRGQPLMPCRQQKSKKLLKEGKAKVIKRSPFTIQLLIPTGETKQEINLGIDTGFGNIGFSATTKKQELISGTLILDGKTKERLEEKLMYRRGRRNRHHWYREPRFDNRTRKDGWLPPSIERRYLTHLNLILKIHQILPITNIILEVAKFDIAKIENPEISGIGYQQGNLYDYQNMRSYLMSREHGKCQFCGNDFKGQSSHIHHIKPRSKGGNDRSNNLVLLHETCHKEIHDQHLEKKLKSNSKDYKHSTFMNIINKKFRQDIPELKITYGNITWVKRNNLNLEKNHINDAFVISNGTNQIRIKSVEIKQVHRNNRVLQLNRKGFKPSIKREKSKVNPGDLFWIGGKQYICKTMFNKGNYIRYGDVKMKEYFNFSKVTKIFKYGSFIWSI